MNPGQREAELWVSRPLPRPDASIRLFCLPYAGTGTAAFRGWPEQLGVMTDVEVLPVRLPGREARLAEPPDVDLARLTAGIEPWLDRPYALYGHSVGARLAFDLARELRRRGRREPSLLGVSGCPAPQLPVPTPEDSELDDDAFLHRVLGLGAMPATVLENAELRGLVLPPLRADFAYVDTYRYRPEQPLDLLLHAFGGDRDPEAPVGTVEEWEEQSAGGFRCSIVPGDHFFVHTAAPRVLALLAGSLAACRAVR